MILNSKGEPMRREIGFLRTMTRVSQPKTEVSTHACGFSIPLEETEVEEASEPDGVNGLRIGVSARPGSNADSLSSFAAIAESASACGPELHPRSSGRLTS
jgi:hypothetical protein